MDKKKFNRIRYFSMLIFTVFGSASSVITKSLNLSNFYFPLYQVFIMYIGEFLAFPIYLFQRWQNNFAQNKVTPLSSLKPNTNKLKLFIFSFVSLLDLINVFLENYCLNYMNPSDFFSLKMIVAYYILAYRIFIAKRKSFKHQWLGLVVFSVGIFLFVLSNILGATNKERELYGVYIGLMFVAELIMCAQFLLIEHFAWELNSSAAEILTIKGCSGLIICGVLYMPLKLIFQDYINLAAIKKPFELVYSNEKLSVLSTTLIFVLGVYNFFLVYLLKMTESLAVCTIDSGRIIIVSIFFALFNSIKLLPLQMVAAICIYLGLAIYNELLRIPCCGLKKSAKDSMKENKLLRKKREEARMWIHGLVFFTENPNIVSDISLNI